MVTLRLFVLIGASLVGCSYVNSEASIGCLFTEELCDKNEWCFDDNVFGRCLAQFGPIDETNFYRYDLEKDALKKLEHEMRRLFRAGYRWSHSYTQCILQNLLFSHRFGVDYNPSLCQEEAGLDQTIDLLKTDPKDLAVIHFSPSRIDRHSDFADEWFMPPLHREKSRQPQHYGNAKKYPEDISSSEGLSSQGKHKRIHLDSTDMTNQQLMDLISLLNAQQIEEENLEEQDDQNTRKAQQNENDYIDSILNKLSPEDLEDLQNLLEEEISTVQENLENGGYNDVSSNRIRNSVSEDDEYGDNGETFDDSNALDANFWDGGFKRLHRYDVKKPGPNFMTNLDEFDSTEAVVNEQLQQASLFKLLDEMMQKQQQKNESVIDQELTADGMINSESDNGEERSTSLEEESKLNSEEPEVEARSAGEASKRKQDDPYPKGKGISANLYGQPPYVPPDTKPANTDDFDVVDTSYAYVIVENGFRNWQDGADFLNALKELLHLPPGIFSDVRVEQDQVTFKVNPNAMGVNASQVASKAESLKTEIQSATGKSVKSAGIGNQVKISVLNLDNDKKLFIVTFVVCGCVAGIVIAVAVLYIVRRHARSREKLQSLGHPDTEPSHDYQDLCRQRMANKNNEKPEPIHAAQRVTSLSRENEATVRSPSSRSSTSSWSEEPVTSNMDISTGHMVLSYMEDHLKNKDRLEQEWVALCAYEAEPCSTSAASHQDNIKKNRYMDVLPYDHSRVVLNDLTNMGGSDYINASTITDHDPRNPAYIATQGPLPHTSADFWQMVWEQGSVVIVTLTRLVENGVAMCHRYWPEEGSELYHIYEVHLVSEHIWCDDYLVRSFYLKNLKTGETRTVTQFHFLSWPDNGVPVSVKALLDFRRKMNKSYRGRSCPIVVHCSDGSGRTGTYTLIDMVLNRMAKGAKEIDIAATLEHIRDQRHLMVKTKGQFEFALMAVAEEVHAILKAMPQ